MRGFFSKAYTGSVCTVLTFSLAFPVQALSYRLSAKGESRQQNHTSQIQWLYEEQSEHYSGLTKGIHQIRRDEWVQTPEGMKYYQSDGSFACSTWKQIGNSLYHFDENGIRQTGWIQVDNKMYLMDSSGAYIGALDMDKYSWNGSSYDPVKTDVLNGIDISDWNGPIDLGSIPADFVIAKASGGTDYIDPSFENYAWQAKNCGKLFGMYHFARDNGYADDPIQEAEFFYNTVKDYIGWGVPILDWEADVHLGPEWVQKFLNRFYELSSVKCVVYASASTIRNYNWSRIARDGYQLWVAQYANEAVTVGYQEDPWRDSWGNGAFANALIHQYTAHGRLPGYEQDLDLNVFYGNEQTWNQLAMPS